MSDGEITGSSPPGLFFAGSDEEGDANSSLVNGPDSSHESLPSSGLQTPAKSPVTPRLFLAASDDDDEEEANLSLLPKASRKPLVIDGHDVEEALPATPTPLPQEFVSCDIVGDNLEGPPIKKRRLSPTAEPRSQSPPFPPTYLGDVLVENAWSTVSGKGYVKQGESVMIRRDGPDGGPSGSNSRKGKNVGKTKKTGARKQVSITSMLKPQTSKPVKKKVDTVVRIVNMRGFGTRLHYCHRFGESQ